MRETRTLIARRRRVWQLSASAIATMLGLLGLETTLRMLEGYSVRSPQLVRHEPELDRSQPTAPLASPSEGANLVSRMTPAAGIDAAWYVLDPKPLPASPVDAELDARYWRHKGHELESVYEWNREYVREAVCARDRLDEAVFRHLDDIYVFDPPDRARLPAYRFLARTHYPSALRTNAFGWRGAEIDSVKPEGRIRVAFVGASTTIAPHDDPFSYPEYVGRWLKEWASARHPSLTVDVINAGREGIDSANIAAIVEQEVLPAKPDLVVYYEGSNQFWPTNFVVNDAPVRLLRTMKPGRWIETHSALGARVATLVRGLRESGAEPIKPLVWVRWPSDLDEHDPPLDDARLPVQLPAILGDLDRIRRMVTSAGTTLALSSFVWVVHNGLVVDPARDRILWDQLNDYYWPFSYAHLRRYVDFENRVFRKYAAVHSLPFIDVDASYPRDPRLFVDAVHMTRAGVKLQAWIVLQQLVPILDAAIASGRLPSRTSGAPAVPRALSRTLVRLDEIRTSCP